MYWFVGGFACGIALALRGYAERSTAFTVLFAGFLVCFACSVLKRSVWKISLVFLVGFSCIACGLGILYTEQYAKRHADPLATSVGEHMFLHGIISDDPTVTEKNQKIILTVTVESDAHVQTTRAITFAPVYPQFSYGDVVDISGVLARPESFVTDSGRAFDYPNYLLTSDIEYIIESPKLTLISHGRGNVVRRFFVRTRQLFLRHLEEHVGEPYAGFASGVVLGVDGALSKDDEETFRRAGLIHIVVVSGYNITLVGDAIARILSALPYGIASIGSSVGIVGFILLSGASATAIRAGIMAGLVLLARLVKRPYDMTRALAIAGFLMLVENPMILLYNPSFQLSFLATWGLSELSPVTTRLFARVPERFGLREICATTLATQIAVVPLLMYTAGSVSILSLASNILALPLVPVLMVASIALGALGFLPMLPMVPIAFAIEASSAYIFFIARLVSGFSFANISVPSVPTSLLVAIYIGLFFFAFIMKKRVVLRESDARF